MKTFGKIIVASIIIMILLHIFLGVIAVEFGSDQLQNKESMESYIGEKVEIESKTYLLTDYDFVTGTYYTLDGTQFNEKLIVKYLGEPVTDHMEENY